MRLRKLELNGGLVEKHPHWSLILPPTSSGYADAQVDDYGLANNRSAYPHKPGVKLRLDARFSQPLEILQGTAGFGFWNAPFGDPTVRWPALPQAVWFFFASQPNDLPFAEEGPGQGWFCATIDASRGTAIALIPLSPFILAANQSAKLRQVIWSWLRRQLRISFQPVHFTMEAWHTYQLSWQDDGCTFSVDDTLILQTSFAPQGPLGFVCWIDNQYLVARPNGRFRWGTLETTVEQRLEVKNLTIERV